MYLGKGELPLRCGCAFPAADIVVAMKIEMTVMKMERRMKFVGLKIEVSVGMVESNCT